MSRAKKKERSNLFSLFERLLAHLLGTSHLPARNQRCTECEAAGHSWCREVQGPDTEHLYIELDSIERRRAA